MDQLLSRLSLWHIRQSYEALKKDMFPHIERMKRLSRGYEILTGISEHPYTITVVKVRPFTLKIEGPNNTYTIVDSERLCTCPDGEVLCKHRFVSKLITSAIKGMQADGLRIMMPEKRQG